MLKNLSFKNLDILIIKLYKIFINYYFLIEFYFTFFNLIIFYLNIINLKNILLIIKYKKNC